MNIALITSESEKALLALLLSIRDGKRLGWNFAKIDMSYLLPFSSEEFSQKISMALREAEAAKIFVMSDEVWVAWSGHARSIFIRLQSSVFFFFLKPRYEHFPAEAVYYHKGDPNTVFDLSIYLRRRLIDKKDVTPVAALPLAPPFATVPDSHDTDERLPYSDLQASSFKRLQKDIGQRSQPEIMVVEDQLFARKILSEMLKNTHKVHVVATAHEGLQTYLDTAPEITFLDIELGDASGHTLARTIKHLNEDAFVVMVTGHGSEDHEKIAARSHVDGFILKPYTKAKILQCLDDYSQRRTAVAMRDSA
jgi:two-component system chemotaxis response regulator CheY